MVGCAKLKDAQGAEAAEVDRGGDTSKVMVLPLDLAGALEFRAEKALGMIPYQQQRGWLLTKLTEEQQYWCYEITHTSMTLGQFVQQSLSEREVLWFQAIASMPIPLQDKGAGWAGDARGARRQSEEPPAKAAKQDNAVNLQQGKLGDRINKFPYKTRVVTFCIQFNKGGRTHSDCKYTRKCNYVTGVNPTQVCGSQSHGHAEHKKKTTPPKDKSKGAGKG